MSKIKDSHMDDTIEIHSPKMVGETTLFCNLFNDYQRRNVSTKIWVPLIRNREIRYKEST